MDNLIPDYNIFMTCRELVSNSFAPLPSQYSVRNLRPEELELWKAMPFDSEQVPEEHREFMGQYVDNVYGSELDLFFSNTLVVTDNQDKIIATCTSWLIYNQFQTIQWFKTKKEYESQGIGRALLTLIMKRFSNSDFPIYLHTQLSSYRAIKLYTDFGFLLILAEGNIGTRLNELNLALSHLKALIPKKDYDNLTIVRAPFDFVNVLQHEQSIQF